MPAVNPAILAFNRGIVDPRALSRIDVNETNRIAFSAEEQTNILPTVLGSASLRPGFGDLFSSLVNRQAIAIPFIYDSDDTAFIEVTDGNIRVVIDDVVLTRPEVGTQTSNGGFNFSLTDWTDADESGAASSWLTGGYMSLLGTGDSAAIRRQEVSVTPGDKNTEHALEIKIERGPVVLRVGSTSGADDYIRETTLGTGDHSLAFTPSGNFHIEFSNRKERIALVNSALVSAAGDMTVDAPWSLSQLPLIRHTQVNDVIFVACYGIRQYRIERRGQRSWSVVRYEPEDGPYLPINTDTLTLAASAIKGDITLTASRALFKESHVGALFRIASRGQRVEASLSAEDTYSDQIRVTGGGESSRTFSVIISGTFSGTLRLQGSYGDDDNFVNTNQSYSAAGTYTFYDMLPNQIVYYRVGFNVGEYTSGTADITIVYSAGSITGKVRVTSYTSPTEVEAAVLVPLGGTAATIYWEEGQWSDYRGWPSAVADYEGRIWWAGNRYINATASETVDSFDDEIEGDSAPISKSLDSDRACWLLPMQRLIAGLPSKIISVRSTSFDEPLTATNFNRKTSSSYRAANVAPTFSDDEGMFVSGNRIYKLAYGPQNNDYIPADIMRFCPEICSDGIKYVAIRRLPDTQLFAVRTDGTMAVFTYSRLEDVECWIRVESEAQTEFVFTLPARTDGAEDAVYRLAKRVINGVTTRRWERLATYAECAGGAISKCLDGHIVYDGAATSTITGLSALNGRSVAVWADGKAYPERVVSGGTVSLPAAVTQAVIGETYEGRYKSSKLNYGALPGGTGLNKIKRVSHIGFILLNCSQQGLQYGPTFDRLDDLPLIDKDGAAVDPDEVRPYYDEEEMEFDSDFDPDIRFCLKMQAPHPCTVSGVTIKMKQND